MNRTDESGARSINTANLTGSVGRMSPASSHLLSWKAFFLSGYLKLSVFNLSQTEPRSRADPNADNPFCISFFLSPVLTVFSPSLPEAKSYVKTHLFLMDFLMNFLAGLLIQALITLRRAARGEKRFNPVLETYAASLSNAWPTHARTHKIISPT